MNKILLIVLFISLPFLLSSQIIPMDGSPINNCSGIFTDSGGSNANYSANENLSTTICPTEPGTAIELFFQNTILGIGDTLCFFDGNSIGASSLGCINAMSPGNFILSASAANTSGCITVTFTSDDINEARGWSASISCTTPCQDFEAEILSTDPPVFPADTGYIDLCIGDNVAFSGGANFSQNNLYYAQDEESSVFRWNMGDGTVLFGNNIMHSYSDAGGYYVDLEIIDTLGCRNINNVRQRIRVTGTSDFNIQTDYTDGTCEGDTIILISDPILANRFNTIDTLVNMSDLPLADGNISLTISNLFVDIFDEGSTIENANETFKICLNIEHSWFYDLEIKLICPSGNSVMLTDPASNLGPEAFLGEPNETDDNTFPPIVTPGIGYDYCLTGDLSAETLAEAASNLDETSFSIPAGTYRAEEPMSNLDGCPLNGEWQLEIIDILAIDNGYLFSWSLDFGVLVENVNDIDTFSFAVANQGWLDQPSIFTNLGDTIFARIDSTQSFTYAINFDNGCMVDTTIVIESQSEEILACSDCSDLIVDAGMDISIDCDNSFATLDASNSSNGEYFAYEWSTTDGEIAGPIDSLTIAITSPGLYIFELSSLLTNCILYDTVMVLPAPNTPMANAGADFPFPCDANQIMLDGSGSTVGPDFQVQWIAETGQIISGANTLNPIITEPGIYILEVINTVSGCTAIDTIVVTSQVFSTILINNATCSNNDGSATVIIPAGTNNPIFSWSNGQTGPTAENLTQGWYSVTVTYDDECSSHQNVFVDEELSCKVQIKGKVVIDNLVPDCFEDGSSNRQKEILLHLLPEDIFTYTNQDGDYLFITETGDHTIEIILPDYLENLCPTDGLITVNTPVNGTVSSENDFYLSYLPGAFDLSINYFSGIARAGMEHVYNFKYCNAGESAASGTLTFIHDEIEEGPSPLPLPSDWNYNSVTNTATWTFTDLEPGECLSQRIDLSIPTTATAGTVLSSSIEIMTDGNDFDLGNNFQSWNQEVVGSFDPNDKQVFTRNGQNQFGGLIYESDTSLVYQIRFQNTGNDTAFAVVIRDTLDQALEVTSIRPGVSSHPYRLEIEGNNILIFNFENIMLPDSNVNLSASQGYATFTIDRQLNIPIGTEITNSAAIYFDYNPPIITNTVINVLSELVSVEDLENRQPSLEVIPNPTHGNFSILYHLKETSNIQFSILDLYGRTVINDHKTIQQVAGKHLREFSLENFPNGIYYIQLSTPNDKVVQKIVKLN